MRKAFEEVPLPIPLTIISGFLGAGKTSLLNHILHAEHGLRVAVLINDFGTVNIDSQLVVGVEGETVSLSNGCICCTIRDDLLGAVVQLLERQDRPEYIIIETSGVSDPLAVAQTFLLPEVNPYIELDSIITVIDAEQILTLEPRYYDLAFSQLEAADMVILNKVDLVSAWQLEAVKRLIERSVENPRILEAIHGQVPLELLLGVGPYDLAQLPNKTPKDVHVHTESDDAHEHGHHEHDPHEHVHHDHTLVFNTWTYSTPQPFSIASLREAVNALPPSIYRIKGFTWLREAPEKRALLQVAGRRAWVRLEEITPGQKQQTTLVLIGQPGAITQEQLAEHFDLCIAEDEVYSGPDHTFLDATFEEEMNEAAWIRTP